MSFEPELMQIQDVCSRVCSGGTPSTRNKEFYIDGTIPWIKTKEVNNNKIFDAETYITEDALAKSSAKLIPKNSIIIAMYGNGDTAGRVAINKIPVATNQACCNLIVDPTKADYRFVFYYLRTQYSKLVDLKNGGAQQNLNAKLLKEYPLPNTSLSIQTYIADFLEQLDDKILLNTQTNQTLEEMAQAIFKSWFVDFDPVKAKMNGEQPEGMDEATASLFPEKLVESELGLIPEGWKVSSLSELIKLTGGGTPKRSEETYWNGDIPWFSVKDVPSGSNVFVVDTDEKITELGLKKSSTKLLPKGTTIITARGTVGKLALVGTDMCMNQSCYGIRGKEVGDYYNYFNLKEAVSTLQRNTHGAVFDTITTKTFDTYSMAFSGAELANEFDVLVAPLLQKIEANVRQNIELATLRDTLLPKLLSGEIELNAITDDSSEINLNLDVEEVDSFIESLLKELKEEDKLSLIYDPFYLEPIVTWMESKDALPYSIVLKIEDALESLNRYISRYYDYNDFSGEQEEVDEKIQDSINYGEYAYVAAITKYCMYLARKAYLQAMCSQLLSGSVPLKSNTKYALRLSGFDIEQMGCDISNWFMDIGEVRPEKPYVTLRKAGETWLLTFPEIGPRSYFDECEKVGYESICHIVSEAFACSVSVVEI